MYCLSLPEQGSLGPLRGTAYLFRNEEAKPTKCRMDPPPVYNSGFLCPPRCCLTFPQPRVPGRSEKPGISVKGEDVPWRQSRFRRFTDAFPESVINVATPQKQRKPDPSARAPSKPLPRPTPQEPDPPAPAPSTPLSRRKREREDSPDQTKPPAPPRAPKSEALVLEAKDEPEVGMDADGNRDQFVGRRTGKRTKEENVRRRAELAQIRLGEQILKQLQIDFHRHWFPKHSFHCDKDHYSKFKLAVATDSVDSLGCEICSEIMNGQEPPEEVAPLQDDGGVSQKTMHRLEILKREEEFQPKPRGRPKANSREQPLPLSQRVWDWIEERRAAIYERVPGTGKVRCQVMQLRRRREAAEQHPLPSGARSAGTATGQKPTRSRLRFAAGFRSQASIARPATTVSLASRTPSPSGSDTTFPGPPQLPSSTLVGWMSSGMHGCKAPSVPQKTTWSCPAAPGTRVPSASGCVAEKPS